MHYESNGLQLPSRAGFRVGKAHELGKLHAEC
jgi:hypothetical protein